jgi:hypothetical protein
MIEIDSCDPDPAVIFDPQPEVARAIRKAKNCKTISLHMKLWVLVIYGNSSVANNLAYRIHLRQGKWKAARPQWTRGVVLLNHRL